MADERILTKSLDYIIPYMGESIYKYCTLNKSTNNAINSLAEKIYEKKCKNWFGYTLNVSFDMKDKIYKFKPLNKLPNSSPYDIQQIRKVLNLTGQNMTKLVILDNWILYNYEPILKINRDIKDNQIEIYSSKRKIYYCKFKDINIKFKEKLKLFRNAECQNSNKFFEDDENITVYRIWGS